MSNERTIGLDIGGSKMAFAVADRRGRVLHKTTIPTVARAGSEDAIAAIAQQLNRLITRYEPVSGIGIGVPGPVDADLGIALHAANLGWKNIAIRNLLSQKLVRPLPIHLDNDVNAGAIGEQLYGAARGIADFVYLSIGTGIGGAAMLDNELLRGASNSEMEIGHISLDPLNGRQCACGLRGCLEMSASGVGMVAHARQHIHDYPDSNIRPAAITTREIIRLAHEGDSLATHVMSAAAQALGIACAFCVNLFNPKLIILAGGLLHAAWGLLEQPVRESLRARCLPLNYHAVTIARSTLSDAALGASALVWHHKA